MPAGREELRFYAPDDGEAGAARAPGGAAPRARAGAVMSALYDRIGRSYVATRAEDPRIAAVIHAALGDARTVLNVGAGAGAYEPRDRDVTAVEPSAVMRAQRPRGRGAVHRRARRGAAVRRRRVRRHDGRALRPPLGGPARRAARAAPGRPARGRVPVGPGVRGRVLAHARLSAVLPGPQRFSLAETEAALGATRAVPVPIPHDCRRRLPDGLLAPAGGVPRPRGAREHLRLLAAAAGRGRRDGRVAASRARERRVDASATPACSSSTRSISAIACSSRNDGRRAAPPALGRSAARGAPVERIRPARSATCSRSRRRTCARRGSPCAPAARRAPRRRSTRR